MKIFDTQSMRNEKINSKKKKVRLSHLCTDKEYVESKSDVHIDHSVVKMVSVTHVEF